MAFRKGRTQSHPAPFKQGHLDGLCGLYASINTLRLACHSAGIRDRIDWATIFRLMLEQLDMRWRVVDVITGGTDKPEIQLCFQTAATYLKRRHSIVVRVSWPWAKRKNLKPSKAIASLWQHLHKKGGALFFGYDGQKDSHWTAVVEITDTHLILSDSWKGYSIPIAGLSFHPEGHWSKGQEHVLCQESVAKIMVARK